MTLGKYKYYFKKPRKEIAKDIICWLAIAGAVSIAASSPYFFINLWRSYQRRKQVPRKKLYDVFYQLRRKGLVEVKELNHQIYISLTDEGKKKAGRLQIDCLSIDRPKKWDKKWRLVFFDISERKRIHRDAFRGKLKELGFYQLQKSVWVHPFDCRAEVDVLREFFGLSPNELRLVVAGYIDEEEMVKQKFKPLTLNS